MELKDIQEKLEGLGSKFEAKANEIADGKNAELKKELENQLSEVKTSLEGFAKTEGIEELKTQLNTLEGKIAEKKTSTKREYKSFNDAFSEAFEEKREELERLANENKSGSVLLELKDVSLNNTLFGNNSDSQVQVTTNTGIIAPIRARLLTYLQSGVSVGSIASTKAMWTEEVDETGSVIPTAELATKPNLNVSYVEKDSKVRKYPAFTKVSTELMADAPQLISRVQSNVIKRINIKIENDLFTGDGSGEALEGLAEYATAYTGGSLATSVADPNNYDVIRGLALQVQENFGDAGAVFVDAGELAKMDLEKDADGRYLLPPFKSADGSTIAGVRLIPTTAFVGNANIDFVGGDLSVVNVLFREGLNIQIDRSGDDFINNKMTILGEARLVQFVSANDTQVLVQGDFASAKTAIEAAV